MRWKLKSALRRQESACSNFLVLILILLSFLSCATYNNLSKGARKDFRQRKYNSAIEKIQKACKEETKNKLLCLYDLGMFYYMNQQYDEAIKTWSAADELSKQIDVVSVSEQTASLVLDDNSIAYRGEHHEKILNSLYLGLSYLFLNKYEDALVETRQIRLKHQVLEQENEKTYKQNAFAKYLSGKLHEAQGEYNEAYLYYRETNTLSPGITLVQDDLLRMAKILNFRQEYNDFSKQFKKKAPKIPKDMAELVFIFENGLSPEKKSYEIVTYTPRGIIKIVAPKFIARSSNIDYIVLKVDEKNKSRTWLLNNITDTAKQQLADRVSIRAAKMVGRFVAKEAIAYGVEKATDNKLLGQLVSFGLQAMQRADTRSWLSLPANLQVGSLWLKPGKYKLQLDFYTFSGAQTGSHVLNREFILKPGQKQFIKWRSFE